MRDGRVHQSDSSKLNLDIGLPLAAPGATAMGGAGMRPFSRASGFRGYLEQPLAPIAFWRRSESALGRPLRAETIRLAFPLPASRCEGRRNEWALAVSTLCCPAVVQDPGNSTIRR